MQEQDLDLPADDAAFLPALPALDPAKSELVSKLAAIALEPTEDTAVGDTGQLTEGTDDALRGSWQPGRGGVQSHWQRALAPGATVWAGLLWGGVARTAVAPGPAPSATVRPSCVLLDVKIVATDMSG